MAMANCGEILADAGLDVILCDWDLEAPGLERYLTEIRKELRRYIEAPGVMDLLLEYRQTASTTQEIRTETDLEKDAMFRQFGEMWLRRPSTLALEAPRRNERRGRLRLINAGRRDDDYYQKYTKSVQEFNWSEFYSEWAGGSYMEFFRKDLEQAGDITLIDSRTGVTEHGGVCTHHLADLVVVLTASNDLNLAGARWMARSLSNAKLTELRGGRPLHILPVAARVEQTAEKEELVQFRRRIAKEFGGFVPECFGDPKDLLYKTEIPYMPYYSFAERVVAREPGDQREARFFEAYQRLTAAIVQWGHEAGMLETTASFETGLRQMAPEAIGHVEVTRIFVSYSMNDSEDVSQFCSALESYSGGKVKFILKDQSLTFGGTNWRKWIEKKITEADAFFLVLSGNQDDWRWCLYEAGYYSGMKEKSGLIVFIPADLETPPTVEQYETVRMVPKELVRFLKQFFGGVEWANRNEPIAPAILKDKTSLHTMADELTNLFSPNRTVRIYFHLSMTISIKEDDDSQRAIPDTAIVKFGSQEAAMLFDIQANSKTDILRWDNFVKRLETAGMNQGWLMELEEAILDIRNKRMARQIGSSFFSESTGKNYRIILSRFDITKNESLTVRLLLVEEVKPDLLASLPLSLRVLAGSLNLGLRYKFEVLNPCIDWLEETMAGGGEDLLTQIRKTFETAEEKQRLEGQRLGLVSMEKFLALFEDPATRSQLRKQMLSWQTGWESIDNAIQSKDLTLAVQKIKALNTDITEIIQLMSHRYHELIKQI
jgi:hypothetical protein